MLIRIRREPFGYVLFDRETRDHQFVHTDTVLESCSVAEVREFLRRYFRLPPEGARWEFITPPHHDLALSAPIALYLEISGRCILNCVQCYKGPRAIQEEMSLAQLTRLLDELRTIGVFEIRLCGNEPTYRREFFEVLAAIKAREFYVGLNTCGYFSGDRSIQREFTAKLLDARPDFIVVSIDGNRETHDTMRLRGSHELAVAFLEATAGAGIPRRVNTVVSAETLSTIEWIAELAERTESDVSYLPLRSVGRSTSYKSEKALTREMMFEAVRRIGAVRERFPRRRFLTYFDILGAKASYHHSMDFNAPCPARKNGFIASDGSYFPCDFLRYLGDRFHCGNVADDGFWKLWSGSQVLKGFASLRHEKCATCRFYMSQCYGGCICGSMASGESVDDELCFVDLM